MALALPQAAIAQTNYFWQTLVANGSSGFEGLGVDASGNIYVADTLGNAIYEASLSGTNWNLTLLAGGTQGTNDGNGIAAQFNQPSGIAVQNSSTLFVVDTENNAIREVQFNGTSWVVTTIAGICDPNGFGSDDGTNQSAQFTSPTGIAVDKQGNLYVADENNQIIRKIQPSGTNWITTTIAGSVGNSGQADGTNLDSQFNYPAGLAVNASGDLFVADNDNDVIREIVPIGTNWVTTTIAGTTINGLVPGFMDGTNDVAEFNGPFGVAVDGLNNVYVADTYNSCIRKISLSGTNWITRTIGGNGSGSISLTDGTNIVAQFNTPYGIAVDVAGNVYVGDTQNNALRLGYLYPPSLQLVLGGNLATISYPFVLGTNFNFTLQSATNLHNPVWLNVTNQWQLTTNLIPFVKLGVTNKVPNRFFRLELP